MSDEELPKCSHCNNQASGIGFGPPLCHECFSKRSIEVPNLPRLASIALGFGAVQHIDALLTKIRVSSGEDVAAALATLMATVRDSMDLGREAKSAAMQQVNYLAIQAAEPSPKRDVADSKLVIDGLKTSLGDAKDVATVWHTVEPILRGMTTVNREQLRRDLSDALAAIQQDHDVTGLDVLAASLTTLEEIPYAFHGRLIQKNLAEIPRRYPAVIWSLVRVIAKLEQET